MENETKENLNDWDDFIGGSFLKANDVEHDGQEFAIIGVENFFDTRDDHNKVRLNLKNQKQKFIMDLNKTNASFLKKKRVTTPKELTGKVITFKKVLVRNPQTNKEVDGLRINSVK